MKQNFKRHLYHFTSAKCANLILKDRKFLPSEVLTCNDPFEMDNLPCFIRFKSDKQLKWYCKETIKLYDEGNPLLSQRLKIYFDNLSISERSNYLENYYEAQKKLLTPTMLLPLHENVQAFKSLKDSSYIYCFAEVNVKDSILLWSRYADRHRGVALEFSFPPEEFDRRLHQVIYPNANVRGGNFSPQEIIDLLRNHDKNRDTQLSFFEKTALTKHSDWKHECEWRFISYVKEPEHQPAMLIRENLISAVYFGINFKQDNKKELIQLIRSEYPGTRIFSTKKNDEHIRLDMEECS